MKDGPDLAGIASLVGDPARANMLAALMDGGSLTASELALEAGVTGPTASSHLGKLLDGGLLSLSAQGRHRYYALSGTQVAAMLEAIMGVAASVGPRRARPGPRDETMREARVCYDHLAGRQAVAMLDGFLARGILVGEGGGLKLGTAAPAYFAALGIDTATSGASRRPVCRACLDWSVRRSHLAGAVGAAILEKILAEGWARRQEGGRAVIFTPRGRRDFASALLP